MNAAFEARVIQVPSGGTGHGSVCLVCRAYLFLSCLEYYLKVERSFQVMPDGKFPQIMHPWALEASIVD